MPSSDVIQLISIIVASVIGVASIIISAFSLRQNSKMIEESTRPAISVYGSMTNFGTPQLYVVVKNFGQTTATITKFDYDFDFLGNQAYADSKNINDWLKKLSNATLAPGQSMICALDYNNINKPITFTIEYKSSTKTYPDKFTVDFKAGTAMLKFKSDGVNGDPITAISYALQEMYQSNL